MGRRSDRFEESGAGANGLQDGGKITPWGQVFTSHPGPPLHRARLAALRSKVASGDLTPSRDAKRQDHSGVAPCPATREDLNPTKKAPASPGLRSSDGTGLSKPAPAGPSSTRGSKRACRLSD